MAFYKAPKKALKDRQNSKDQCGAAIVEYILIVLLIAMIAFPSIRDVGHQMDETYYTVEFNLGMGGGNGINGPGGGK